MPGGTRGKRRKCPRISLLLHNAGTHSEAGALHPAGTPHTSVLQPYRIPRIEADTTNLTRSMHNDKGDRPGVAHLPVHPSHLAARASVIVRSQFPAHRTVSAASDAIAAQSRLWPLAPSRQLPAAGYWPPKNIPPRVDWNIIRTAGVIRMMQIDGKISKAIGISILIGALWANSSASWRRLIRI